MGLIRGVARTAVIAGTATAVSNRVSRRQAGRWAQQEQEQQEQEYQRQQMAAMQAQQQQQQASAPAADPMQGRIEQLKSLADLKAQGILTEEEFQAQKNAILNG